MAVLVDVLRRGDRFLLEARHFEHSGYDEKTNIGLAIDTAEKERFAALGATISGKYAPHDFLFDGIYYDIKSSQGKWLSISYRELEFAEAEMDAGRDVIYVIYLQKGGDEYEYLGCVSFAQIYAMMRMGSTPYWSLSVVKSNLL